MLPTLKEQRAIGGTLLVLEAQQELYTARFICSCAETNYTVLTRQEKIHTERSEMAAQTGLETCLITITRTILPKYIFPTQPIKK